MGTLEQLCVKLQLNSESVFKEVRRLLIKIANNILQNADVEKVRILQKCNVTVKNKVLGVEGGIDFLRYMGFVENEASFIFPKDTSLQPLINTIEKLDKLIYMQSSSSTHLEEKIVPYKFPPFKNLFPHNAYLTRIEHTFHNALGFSDKKLHERALKLIPLVSLEIRGQNRLRQIQLRIKLNQELNSTSAKESIANWSIEDCLLIELLHWFKNDFFTWINKPCCSTCGNPNTVDSNHNTINNPYTNRVEVYRCTKCSASTAFPRYNDLNILLETRKGRCGEWAQIFTLFCIAIGWDARYVVDENDHVWTEVFSVSQDRWIHTDPSECAFDTPLIYEHGWRKEHTYIIAYSPLEVQDVTWRYSNQHKQILSRRNYCTENELVSALMLLSKCRQENFSLYRKVYLAKRLLKELIDLMIERQVKENEDIGRISGDLQWRLNRGETQNSSAINDLYFWSISNTMSDQQITIRYSTSLDRYEYLVNGSDLKYVTEWIYGAYQCENIFRKEENDWKIVYLARIEGTDYGAISWQFIVNDETKAINTLNLKFAYTTFENGCAEVTLKTDVNNDLLFIKSSKSMQISQICGAKTFTISAKLTGGKGSNAWQHSQLFRQSVDSDEFPFEIILTFKDV